MFSITEAPIDRTVPIEGLSDERAGALVVFEGWVRDHNQGKKVRSLEYQIYPELALKEGHKIILEAQAKFNVQNIECIHRFGHLRLGDIAVWVGAVASHRDDAFKATRYIIDEIKYRLPIWKKEHYELEEAQWVFCRDHHTHVHFDEKDYYRKQIKLVNQEALKKARVLVVGAGGLGCPALVALTTAGVGRISIADFDKIDISNIHRQPLYSPGVVGEKKVVVAQKRLSELNSFIHIEALDLFVDVDNVEELIQNQDLVLDCTDNMRTKLLLHDACFKHQIPLVSASVYRDEGQIRSFDPKSQTGCLRCSYEKTPEDALLGNCNDFGVLGASLGVIGGIQAREAISFLLTQTNTTVQETFYFDIQSLSVMKIKNIKRDSCPCCLGLVELKKNELEVHFKDLGEDFVLVDIQNTPAEVLEKYIGAEKKIAVLCHRGIKSLKAVQALRAQGHQHFYSVKGGACSLS